MRIFILLFALIGYSILNAQNVGIGTNTPKDYAKLDIESNNSGLLMPRVNNAQRNTLGSNVSGLGAGQSAGYSGLMVFDTEDNAIYMWDHTKTDFTNGGWVNVLDEDVSLDDADADPTNELQTLSISASTLTLSDGGGSVDLPAPGYSLSANLAFSPDDIGNQGWQNGGTLTGDDASVDYTMPFSLDFEGTSYSVLHISTNGWLSFGAGGGTDFSNDCFPTGAHSTPFIAAYWDDLVANGNNIRYGFVGSAPNRTVIVDYECRTFTNSYNVRFQVQIHESSGLINVQYRDEMNANANGQSATIGFQLNTSTSYPITCNGKVLEDNRDNEMGWSIAPTY